MNNLNITQKIIKEHLVSGDISDAPGSPISIKIDQTLTQDATGTMAFLEFEAMDIPRVKTEVSVSYVDHNMMMVGPENHNDHLYLQSISRKIGAYHSRPGNGICHQVHLERFGAPGKTLLGSDSHTPTGGGLGMMAIGAGGLDVALAMGGKAFKLSMPKVIGVKLTGQLREWVSAKDVILHMLSLFSVKGNVGCVMEYFGEGIKTLSVPERATITNMGAEMGVTTSIFPSDEITKDFLRAQDRENDYQELKADENAEYEKIVEINLSEIEPLLAAPSSPGNIKKAREVKGKKINQVIIGSCTNSSFRDLMIVAGILENKLVHPDVEISIAPGSRQVLQMMSENGALSKLIKSGVKILENGCGPCIGQGQSPGTDTVTLRTFNRNFTGRSGTKGDQSYLCSPELAALSALAGEVVNPIESGQKYPEFSWPEKFIIDDSLVQEPMTEEEASSAQIKRGATIGNPPKNDPLGNDLKAKVFIKTEDNTTTDHIMPAGQFLKYRSDIGTYSKYVFHFVDENFATRAKEEKDQGNLGIIVGGESYGQGSSREHAAICPAYLGIKAVITKSMERIHKANLINFGIVPLEFVNKEDYEKIDQNDEILIEGLKEKLEKGEDLVLKNLTKSTEVPLKYELTSEDVRNLVAGGVLNV